jgi:membrane protein YqaA with SNARE-associated domain
MKLFAKVFSGIRKLRRYVDRPWYPFAIAGLSAIDFFVIIIPSDGIIVASAIARPRKWISLSLAMAIGSLLGGFIMALIVRHYGESFISWFSPNLLLAESWQTFRLWIEDNGMWAIFIVAISPIVQQPVILLAGLTDMPIYEMVISLGVGRVIKFLVYGWVASHTPKVLNRIPTLKGELEDLDVETPPKKE